MGGNYTITYEAWDLHGNKANAVNRTVIVADTQNPYVKLNAAQGALVEIYARTNESQSLTIPDSGATCHDDCDQSIGSPTTSWDRPFNDKVLGNYVRTYTCQDAGMRTSSITRTFKVVDND